MSEQFHWMLCLFLLLLLLGHGCKKSDQFTSAGVTLQFSTDSIIFDTIFSRLGGNPNLPRSVTLQLKVINPNKNAVNTNISLEGNLYGLFKLNVDGRGGNTFSDVEIRGKDSIYIFVQAYIDQVNNNTPFLVTDQIQFNTNGVKQGVALVAWTQDANYIQNDTLPCSGGNTLWTADKPYVIYDSMLVQKGCTLTISPGTHIYNFNKSVILVQGTLIVNGTVDNPVIFEGSRLDADYKEVAGQWIGIHFLPGSSNNFIQGAIIKNGYIGIRVDSMPTVGNYGLRLKQCTIKNMSAVGLLNYTAKLYAENCLVYNCGLYSFIGELGGNYDLYHNTFVMSNSATARKDQGFYLSNAPWRDENGNVLYAFPLAFNLKNNIIVGSIDDEFLINKDADGQPIVTANLNNNLIKSTNGNYSIGGNFLNIDPKFTDSYKYNYDLQSSSPCKGTGVGVGVLSDIKNRSRNSQHPSMGAYEAQ